MKFTLQLPRKEFAKGIFPLVSVADAMARAYADLGISIEIKFEDVLGGIVEDARYERIRLVDEDGFYGSFDQIILRKKAVGWYSHTFDNPNASAHELNAVHCLLVCTRLPYLNTWASERGDEFCIDANVHGVCANSLEIVERPIRTTERNTLLTIIAALCAHSRIKHQGRGAATDIAKLTEIIGAAVSDDAVRQALAKIPDALESRKK